MSGSRAELGRTRLHEKKRGISEFLYNVYLPKLYSKCVGDVCANESTSPFWETLQFYDWEKSKNE